MPQPPRPSTEDHRPPSTSAGPAGTPMLLGAFPKPIAVPFPANGTLGREEIAATGHLDTKMSGEHVRCALRRGAFFLEDAGSRNGTFVNGQRLNPGERVELIDGAIVRLAVTLFVFRAAHAGGPHPARPVGGLIGPWGLTELRVALSRLPNAPANVLLEGATGVGKELLAPEVAARLGRDPRKFGPINVASIPESMFDGQLFGWERGAFSGAAQSNPGVFRSFDRGTVFLDEIGELPPSLQPKLLRLLENREVWPIGASHPTRVDLAVIGATHRPLEEMVETRDFRADLLARFPIRLTIPSLADRPEDLPAITTALWERRHGALDLSRTRVDAEAVERMMLHDWPANVRDLDRLLAGLEPRGGIKLSSVQAFLGDRAPTSAPVLTRASIEQALTATRGNQSEAAKRLGVDRGKLRRTMKQLGMTG